MLMIEYYSQVIIRFSLCRTKYNSSGLSHESIEHSSGPPWFFAWPNTPTKNDPREL